MSQITKASLTFSFLLLLSVVTLAGCGSSSSSSSSISNPQSNFDSSTGKHPAGWVPASHKTAAVANLENCTPCHGADYKGGISRIACTACHMGGVALIHPPWGTPDYATHGSYVKNKSNDTSGCANARCHGTNLDGAGGTGPSCSSCHMGGVALIHPPWGTPDYATHGTYVKSNSGSTSGCANIACHGTTLTGVSGSGPSCTLCHMGVVTSMHPLWGTPDYAMHGSYVKSNSNNTLGCANVTCHGTTLTGVSGSGPSCTLCHLGGVASMHPPWGTPDYATHGNYVKNNSNDTSGCANVTCHGSTLTGVSGSGPSCTSCHMGGVASMHPPWGTPAYAKHGTYVQSNSGGNSGCANVSCHGSTLAGVSGSGPSCTLCHMGGVASIHPPEWNGNTLIHKTKAGFTDISSCRNTVCHGAALEGVYLSGPSCYICH